MPCVPCVMKPLRPPNYYRLQGSQSSLHESNSTGEAPFPLHSEHTEVSSLFSLVHKSWHLNLATGASWKAGPPEAGRVRALGVPLLLWESNGSTVLQRRAPLRLTVLDPKVFVVIADVFWSELGGRRSLGLERTLCSWHSKVLSLYLGHSPKI